MVFLIMLTCNTKSEMRQIYVGNSPFFSPIGDYLVQSDNNF